MKPFMIAILINPLLALVFLTAPVFAALWLWRRMPDGRIKRLLFRSYGKDSGPWVSGRAIRSVSTRK